MQDSFVSWIPYFQGTRAFGSGALSTVIEGPTMNVTINYVAPPDFMPPFKPIFEDDDVLL